MAIPLACAIKRKGATSLRLPWPERKCARDCVSPASGVAPHCRSSPGPGSPTRPRPAPHRRFGRRIGNPKVTGRTDRRERRNRSRTSSRHDTRRRGTPGRIAKEEYRLKEPLVQATSKSVNSQIPCQPPGRDLAPPSPPVARPPVSIGRRRAWCVVASADPIINQHEEDGDHRHDGRDDDCG